MNNDNKTKEKEIKATINACKLCSPLGASIVFRGVKNAMPLIHGGQGCSTYIRRYIISHFKEPMDIASSSFTEEATVFGGESNLITGIENVIKQYNPELIGIATSCLSETIGEDISLYVNKYLRNNIGKDNPKIVHVATPSYSGTHIDGFHKSVKAIIETLVKEKINTKSKKINILPGFLSPADLRYIKEVLEDFDLSFTMLPDYSETLDAPIWDEYKKIPEGGTSIDQIETMNNSVATIEFGKTISNEFSGAFFLEEKFGIKRFNLGFPIGIKETDQFFNILEKLSGLSTPNKHKLVRGRLIDSYVDGHKYLFGKKAVVYGEEDLVIGITNFLFEIGIIPIIVASGGNSGKLKDFIQNNGAYISNNEINILNGVDFSEIEEIAFNLKPDLIIGNSKGYKIARKLNIPHIRVGFPIHDRIGGQRILHVGYNGTQNLFDSITNALIEYKQENSPVGYSYI
ncbi:MAG: nitrogenase [Spirochaetes bacterium GWB1_27_13]|nr:MAG: nitrogenase [Spirochaetes bacterium GWB1_27_13]